MKLTKEWVENELKHSEALENHRPPDEEYAFYCAVRDGDMEYVQKNCTAEVFSNPTGMGVLAKDPLQNLKYHFVITAALVTRYCITGGMAAEQGYRLSDFTLTARMPAPTSTRWWSCITLWCRTSPAKCA
ncbi:MAG: hypothetical protein ACLRYE_03780 [Gemmiger formicilis]|uniref:hypothetical protein n=1 Tax=Gemmiger formicilis TaxID=745368 RepID=UPI0039A1BC6B